MVKTAGHPGDAIVALKIQGRESLPFCRFLLQSRSANLGLQTLVILPAAVSDFLGLVDIHRRQVGIGCAIGKLDLLFGGKTRVSMFDMTKLVNKHLKDA